MEDLMTDTLLHLFDYLSLGERAKLRQVSRKIKKTVEYGLKKVNYISLAVEGTEYHLHPTIPWYKFVFMPSFAFDSGKLRYFPCKINYSLFEMVSSLFKFINDYCGDSIVLHLPYELSMDDLLPLTGKLKFLQVPVLKSNGSFENVVKTLNQFTKLEGIVVGSNTCNEIADLYNAIQVKLSKDGMVSRLYLPFRKKKYPQLLDKASLRHLYVDNSSSRSTPIELKKEITDLLVELDLNGNSKITLLPENSFSCLKILTVNNSPKIEFWKTFQHVYHQLEYLNMVIVLDKKDIILGFIRSCTSLREVNFSLKAASENLPGNDLDQALKLDLTSPNLRKMVISCTSDMPFHLSVSSKKLRYIELKYLPLKKLEADFSKLEFLNVDYVRFQFDFLPQLMTAGRLKCLRFVGSICAKYSECIDRMRNFINLKHLARINLSMNVSNRNSRHIIYIRSVPSSPMIDSKVFAEFENQYNNFNIMFDYKDERPFKEFEHLSAYKVRLDINQLDDLLVSFLTQNCPDVSDAIFDDYYLLPCNIGNRPPVCSVEHLVIPVVKLFKSWKNLTKLEGMLTQEQVYQILINLSVKQLTINHASLSFRPEGPLSNELHDLLVKLVESESLVIERLPWFCADCNDHPCPLSKKL